MNNAELQVLTKQWSCQLFGRPFLHQIYFNSRLKTTGGRYHLSDNHIDINPLMYTEYNLDSLKRVVLHELCHYHLHLLGKDYHHQSAEFRSLLSRVGGARYAPPTSKRQHRRVKWYYQCTSCGIVIGRQRRFNTSRYVCRRCGSKFKLKKFEKKLVNK